MPGTYDLRYIAEFPQSGRDDTSERALLFRQTLTVAADAPDWSADVAETEEVTAVNEVQNSEIPEAGDAADPTMQEGDDTQSNTDDIAIDDDLGYLCEEQLGCSIEDRKTGISFFLRPGWVQISHIVMDPKRR